MDYSEMKATKESRSDKIKDAVSSAVKNATSKSSSGTRKKSSSSSKSGSSTRKTGSSSSTRSTGTRKTSSSSRSTKTKSSSTSAKKSTTKNNSLNDAVEKAVNKTSANTTRIIKTKAKRQIKKSFKGIGLGWILIAIFLVVGLVGGYIGARYVCRFDVYEMQTYENGQADITIGLDEDITSYQELGVKCIAFGKDISHKFTVKYYYRDDLTEDEVEVTGVDVTQPGIYYAVYSVPTVKYKMVKLIRNIIIMREEDNG